MDFLTQEFITGALTGVTIAVTAMLFLKPKPKINTSIKLDQPKVVDSITVKDIEDSEKPLLAMVRTLMLLSE